MRIMRGILLALAWLAGGLLALVLITFAIAAWVWRDIPAERLEARYATPASQFAEIDGARIHFCDEGGPGPAVVLIHANFASLIGWDPWVENLRDRYRVVRFDMTSHGLSGADEDFACRRPGALDYPPRAARIHAEDGIRRSPAPVSRAGGPLARPVAPGRAARGAA